ncbi:fibronectin type III domain-containing protein [Nitrospira sp. BLG_1]|uniref:fibronectin type III domain-containing protein n=1 Tax=Nitrospira sp. BLG_1 TaxID=3395883 RepID=UPI0039BCDE01
MSWDLGASDDWVISAVSVNPVSAPPATLTISVSDSIVVPDVIVVESVQRLLVSASDTVTVTEFVSAGRTLGVSRFDLVAVTEFATIDLSLRRITVFDAVGVADAVFLSSIAPRVIDVSDSVGVNVGAAQVSWTANTEPDLAGYKVYYGTSSGVYTTVIDVGLTATPATPSHTIYNLTKGVTYYFNVTAYDTSNNESGFGTEVSKLVRGPVGNWYQVSILQGSLTKIESVSVAEAVTVNVAPKPSAFDLRSVAEFWQVFVANNGSVGIDTLTVTESVSLLLATAPTLTISVFEAVTLSESITLKRPELLSSFDAVTVAESHSIEIVSGVSGADAITVEEAVTIIFPTNQISPFDSLAVTELVSLMLNPAQFSAFDQIFMGEGHEGRFVAIGTGTGDGTGRVTQIAGISGITVIT